MMTPSERDKGPGSHDANGIIIREAVDSDLEAVLQIERAAFGSDEEADLVEDLLGDVSARPLLSLIALMDKEPSGHILFTHASLDPDTGLKAALLAPLAVTPEHQKMGIGGSLIREGLKRLQASGTDLVFVRA